MSDVRTTEICSACGEQGVSEIHICGHQTAFTGGVAVGDIVSFQWCDQCGILFPLGRNHTCLPNVAPCKTPHKCPACDGWGKRKNNTSIALYGEADSVVDCPACKGAGLVWEP